MMLVAVPTGHVAQAWVEALPLIRRIADSAPDLTLDELWRSLRSGDSELWLAGTDDGHCAVAITRLRQWGDGTAAYVLGVASDDAKAWRTVIPEWRAALKARGADTIIIEGRKGWERMFPDARLLRQVLEMKI